MAHRRTSSRRAALPLLLLLVVAACGRAVATARSPDATAREEFWAGLRTLCGRAWEGRLVAGNASDSAFRRSRLVMHVRECGDSVIRIPFHVGDDRSRTWVITRRAAGLRLKHDHRHADGSEDAVTQYGGDAAGGGTHALQRFPADSFTAALLPAARTNVWTVEVVPGQRFAYELRRTGTDRHVRVEFDLARPVPAPPPPWGAPASPR